MLVFDDGFQTIKFPDGFDHKFAKKKVVCNRCYSIENANQTKQEPLELEKDEEDDEEENSRSTSSRQLKRPRTTLTSKQRQIFRNAFENAPKPCRKVSNTFKSQN